ncbi:hypothetical protein AVEN_150934-1 [Araneus ventricosus]|uniref:Uncharacterized protein n=1 Tax=Araneus ventricosus TaxID=182803 RepID=A0A4Y2X614_ARAVE|nr:hypothetical protein AVEN_150934-1 [Araneus ventricosus]
MVMIQRYLPSIIPFDTVYLIKQGHHVHRRHFASLHRIKNIVCDRLEVKHGEYTRGERPEPRRYGCNGYATVLAEVRDIRTSLFLISYLGNCQNKSFESG